MKAWRLALALVWHCLHWRGGDTIYIDARGLSGPARAELDRVSLAVTELSWVGDDDRFAVLVAEPEDLDPETAVFWDLAERGRVDPQQRVDELTADVAQLEASLAELTAEAAMRQAALTADQADFVRLRKVVLRCEAMLEACREQHGSNALPVSTLQEIAAVKRSEDL